ncbi:MAG: superoxide dismutase family protein [bacterium]
MRKFDLIKLIIPAVILVSSCQTGERKTGETSSQDTIANDTIGVEQLSAIATIEPASGSRVTGTASFEQAGEGVKMTVNLQNVPPGKHGFHVHEKGDCSAKDAASAGGHWNPTGKKHGQRGVTEEYHRGDLATNLEAGEDSTINYETTISDWTIGGPDSTNIVGKSLILHAMADDFKSQPSGNSGPRIGCGVIKKK